MEYKMVIVLRSDLDISCGKAVAQGSHAALTCGLKAKAGKGNWYRKWFSEGQRKVVLKVADLEALRDLEMKAQKEGFTTAMIQDAGLTELPPGTATALAIGPAPEHMLDHLTGSLPLY